MKFKLNDKDCKWQRSKQLWAKCSKRSRIWGPKETFELHIMWSCKSCEPCPQIHPNPTFAWDGVKASLNNCNQSSPVVQTYANKHNIQTYILKYWNNWSHLQSSAFFGWLVDFSLASEPSDPSRSWSSLQIWKIHCKSSLNSNAGKKLNRKSCASLNIHHILSIVSVLARFLSPFLSVLQSDNYIRSRPKRPNHSKRRLLLTWLEVAFCNAFSDAVSCSTGLFRLFGLFFCILSIFCIFPFVFRFFFGLFFATLLFVLAFLLNSCHWWEWNSVWTAKDKILEKQ